jgi:hypothetical protein
VLHIHNNFQYKQHNCQKLLHLPKNLEDIQLHNYFLFKPNNILIQYHIMYINLMGQVQHKLHIHLDKAYIHLKKNLDKYLELNILSHTYLNLNNNHYYMINKSQEHLNKFYKGCKLYKDVLLYWYKFLQGNLYHKYCFIDHKKSILIQSHKQCIE